MNRVIDISVDGRHLSLFRGFLVISEQHNEIARVALDDIGAIIVHAHGVTYTNSLLVELANRGVIVVLCAANHFPIAYIMAVEGNHTQSGRMADQIGASLPLQKQLWRQIVIHKIRMQASTLSAFGIACDRLNMLARDVKSGDPSNIEAQAARHYWPLLLGSDFRRDRSAEDANALLNYGYTVLRAAVTRSIVATGLIPSLGIHHKSQVNAFALADDLIEPFRPLVDVTVRRLVTNGHTTVSPETKRALAALLDFDVNLGTTRSPVKTAIATLCNSLVTSYANRKAKLIFLNPPDPISLSALGVVDDHS